jgi:hypothetical protein
MGRGGPVVKNPFRQARVCECGDHGFVGLTKGAVALFSPADIVIVQGRHWCARTQDRNIRYAESGPLAMHRAICGGDSQCIDHIDSDGLNNRRENLRPCTVGDNLKNQRKRANTACRFKGAYPEGSGFAAKISLSGKTVRIGSYATAEEAAAAYDRAAIRHYGSFARTNAMLGLLPDAGMGAP